MVSLAALLAQSAAVRPTVQAAINSVESCQADPESGEATLETALTTRQQILSGLQNLVPTGLSEGPTLVSSLSQAVSASITADGDYQSYMQDIDNGYTSCDTDPTTDANFEAGQAASQQATSAKNSFDSLWNPLAASYGLPTYTSDQY